MYNIVLSTYISQKLQSACKLVLRESFELAQKVFHCLYMLSFLISSLAGAYSSNDNEESIFLLAVSIGYFVQSFRMLKLFFGKSSIVDFLHNFSSHSTTDNEQLAQINEKLKYFIKLSLFYFALCAVAVACIAIEPLLSNERILYFNIAFPLDWKNDSFSFWMSYFFTLGAATYSLVSCLFSIINWYLMINCTIEYEIFGNQLRQLGVMKASDKSECQSVKKPKFWKMKQQKLYEKQLVEAIKTHRNIDRMVDEFANYFEDSFVVQIGTGGLCICGSIYSMIFMNTDNVIYSIYMIYSLFDTFVVMLLGNQIKESSDRLSYHLFESDWLSQSTKCQKCVIIMTEVLKKPKEIIVCKLYPLNLQTFSSILHGAYSMFNILKSLK